MMIRSRLVLELPPSAEVSCELVVTVERPVPLQQLLHAAASLVPVGARLVAASEVRVHPNGGPR